MADKKNLIPKNLVIVRAGDNSLHEGWIEGTRNWDLIVSGYGEASEKWQRHDAQRDDITHIFYKGGKFDGLYDAFQQVPGLLDKYDYIMMADDDFKMTAHALNRLFEIMREHDLQIGHPSFSYQSHGLYFPAYHNPRFKIRFTNFVENGVACLHRSVWQQLLPIFEDNPMGYYIDNFWARLTDDPARQVALIDEIQVTHSRPYESGGLHRKMKQYGWQEEGPVQYFVPDHMPDWDQWRLPKIVCHAAIDADAHFISSREKVLPLLVSGWSEIKENINPTQIYGRGVQECMELAIENQKTGRSNLSKTRISVIGHKDRLYERNISLMKNSEKKNLIIVRAGDDSLHEDWLEGERNWDIIVSCYGNPPHQWKRDDIMFLFYRGGKGDGLYDAFQQVPGLLDKYDYIMMADDDFKMTADDINRTFDTMREHDLQIGQPSFSHQSYGLYFPTYHNPRFKIRFTNFVENGVACLHRSVWQQLLPIFDDNPMGYYIDNFWARLTDDPARQVALIDEVQVTHSRIYESGGLHRKMKQYGWQEEGPVQYFVPDHMPDWDQWRLPKIVCHAAIDADGHSISGREKVLPLLVSGWSEIKENISAAQIYENRSAQKCIDLAIENQKTGRSNLSKTRISVIGHKNRLYERNISLMKNSDKKNLIIVRAGDDSLHEGWLKGKRNWDIIVSCYGDQPHQWKRDDIIFIFHRGGKGDGLYDAFQQVPGLLDKYDYIMMADDDFKMTADDINRTFDTMRKYDLQIGHPSFSHQSYGLYFPTYHNPRFKIRFTNFVENGVACLHRSVWQQLLPIFDDNPMGYYIDNFWARLTDDPARQVALIDEVQVTHSRIYESGGLHRKMKQYGWQEEGPVQYFVPDHTPDWDQWRLPKIVCHAAIDADGHSISSREKVLPLLVSGWSEIKENISAAQIYENRSAQKCIDLAIENQKTGRSNLSKTRISVIGHKNRLYERNISLMKNSDKKNLIIVRAGDDSLHEGWLKGKRNWDIIVSCYGDQPHQWKRDDIIFIFHRGGKGDGLYDAFQQVPGLLDKYDYIMMADDDFKMTADDINRTFDTMRKYDLQIGHPSFSHQSYGLYFPTYHNPRFKIRFTNFVENGVACLHRSVWQQLLPIFDDNPMGYYIDNFWARLTDDPARQVALIDEVQVTHSRIYESGGLHRKMKQYGWQEEGPVQYFVPDHTPDWDQWRLPKIVCHAAIDADGHSISSREKVLPLLVSGWSEIKENISAAQIYENRSAQKCIDLAIENQKTGRSNLSKTRISVIGHKNRLYERNISLMKNSDKKNLIIVRAGDDSLHEGWLKGKRNWDIIVSCYGDQPHQWKRDDIIFIFHRGGKGDGLYDAFQQVPGLLDKYDYIMMADDDFKMTADDINRTFDTMRKYDLQIGHPSFSHQSYGLYFPTYHNPRFKIRFTNFVENGVACLHRSVWQQLLPIFDDNPMGYYIDNFWARLTDDPACQVALIDEIQVTHSRIYEGGGLHRKMKQYGWQEEGPVQYFVPDHTPDWDQWRLPKIVCHAAIDADGRVISSRERVLPLLVSGWSEIKENISAAQIYENRSAQKCIDLAIENQKTGRSNLSKTRISVVGRKDRRYARNISLMKNSDKKNLVIVRAGDRSLHEGWLEGERNWDIIVSCYGNQPHQWKRDDIIFLFYRGGKGDGIYDAFQQIPGLLDKYDYIMMADDDFKMTADDINRTFDTMRKYDLQIGQPSFSHQSHMVYHPELHNPQFKIRFSNFVEAITVCLSVNIWRQILPLYQNNPLGWCIDHIWGRLTDEPSRQIAFIDEVQVTHTRPCQTSNIYEQGWSIYGPVQYTVSDYTPDLDKWWLPRIVCHEGILTNGRRIHGRWAMLLFLIAGWIKTAKHINRTQILKNRSVHKCIRRSIKNQITGNKLTKGRLIVHGYYEDN